MSWSSSAGLVGLAGRWRGRRLPALPRQVLRPQALSMPGHKLREVAGREIRGVHLQVGRLEGGVLDADLGGVRGLIRHGARSLLGVRSVPGRAETYRAP